MRDASPRHDVAVQAAAGAAILFLLALFSALEAVRPLRPRVDAWGRRALVNAGTFALAEAVAGPLRYVIVVPAAGWVAQRDFGLVRLVAMPPVVRVVLALVLLDLTLWAWHVLNHRVGWLWRFHAAHHADLDLDATTALRFHFGEFGLSVGWRLMQVVVIGVGPTVLFAWEAGTLALTLFHHANIALPERLDRALSHLMPTPRSHGIHHSVVRAERDGNYGIALSLWDIVFGTFDIGPPQSRIVIGLPDVRTRPRFWALQAMPFRSRSS